MCHQHSCDIADRHTQLHCVVGQSQGPGRDQASEGVACLPLRKHIKTSIFLVFRITIHKTCLQTAHEPLLVPFPCFLPPSLLNQVFLENKQVTDYRRALVDFSNLNNVYSDLFVFNDGQC